MLVFVVSLCACSNINHKKALIGTWKYTNYEYGTYYEKTFRDDNTYSSTAYCLYSGVVESTENGEYSICGGEITIINSYGKKSYLPYEYENGKIIIDDHIKIN